MFERIRELIWVYPQSGSWYEMLGSCNCSFVVAAGVVGFLTHAIFTKLEVIPALKVGWQKVTNRLLGAGDHAQLVNVEDAGQPMYPDLVSDLVAGPPEQYDPAAGDMQQEEVADEDS